MYLYLPIANERQDPDTYHPIFGLRVLKTNSGVDEELMLLPEISSNFSFVLRLASILTRKQLDPLRILEVIERSW